MLPSRLYSAILILMTVAVVDGASADQEWVKVADDGKGFVFSESGRPFVPWGFNYDHEENGKLIEDYWDLEWGTVESAFQEMKQLGANVVRIHLQFGAFMKTATEPRHDSLGQLARLVKLAESTGLYLDLTGLGCYHKQDVPPWYDNLDEADRWRAQAVFWEAVAKTCTNSPAIFCYDLMNEPVVGGETKRNDWLGNAFAGKHFVQFIVLETKGRPRHEIARQWVGHLARAIRKHDRRHLVTVGLVPWSLDRPGLTSGFVPHVIADDLDFIAMHIYPERGKLDEAMDILRGFAAAGKPVVIEEIFPLKCGARELGQFIDESREYATGWIGFYWGTTPAEYRRGGSIGNAITLSWLELFQQKTWQILSQVHPIRCEGAYRHHLQGICTNNKDEIYWSFTTTLVKTDASGKVSRQIEVRNHHGDLCYHDGKIYVAVNLGQFNDPDGNADSWIYVYKADDLSLVAKHETHQVFHGAGGIGYRNGHFFIVGGLPEGIDENYVYEYDFKFEFLQRHAVTSGHTHLGIQTVTFANNRWWFGCYGEPKTLLVTAADFAMQSRYEFDCSLGIVGLPNGQFLVAEGRCDNDGCTGWVRVSAQHETNGLRVIAEPEAPTEK